MIHVVSSDEEFVTTETVEEFAAIEAFEHSGDELAIHTQCISDMVE